MRRWLRRPARGLRLLERVDEIGQGAVVDLPAALGRRDGQTDGQMRLADAERTEEDDVLLALHEAELVQRVDLFPLHGGLEAEVEVGSNASRSAGGGCCEG